MNGLNQISMTAANQPPHGFDQVSEAHSVELLGLTRGQTVDITFGILGRTAIRIGGRLQENSATPKVQALLATLLVHAGHSVSVDKLVEWAWPEDDRAPLNRLSTMHTYATRIRRLLDRLPNPPVLHTGNGIFRLDIDNELVDYYRFQALVNAARVQVRENRLGDAVDTFGRAFALWRGRPLDDLESPPASAWRTHVLRNEWLPANVMMLDSMLRIGEPDQVITALNKLMNDFGEELSLVKTKLSALVQLNRAAEATRYYFAIRRQLLDEGDDDAADHLKQHHDNLRAYNSASPAAPDRRASRIVPRQMQRNNVNFVGRGALLRELSSIMKEIVDDTGAGLVILDGMPGVGKTALAVHWAHTIRHLFEDGDFFVNMNGFSANAAISEASVIDDLLLALGQQCDNTLCRRSRELLLSRVMTGRRMLIVLDNVRNSEQIRNLVSLMSDCFILVTSRQQLTSLSAETGARRVQVARMPDNEGVELLTKRLRAGTDMPPAVRDELLSQCGGLPLVINILAEHVASSDAAAISAFAGQVSQRQIISEFGEDGDGASMARTFFSWSYNALPPAEKRLFRLLGLHPSPEFAMSAAAACDGTTAPDTKRSLGILVGAHLLERSDLDHYRFHDLLYEFANYCAELSEQSDQRAAAEDRMISYYLEAATQAHLMLYAGHSTPPVLGRDPAVAPVEFEHPAAAQTWFGRELANLVAVVHRARDLGHHAHAWRLADTIATFMDRHGQFEESRSVREIAVASASAAGDREAEASSRVGLAMVLITLGEFGPARQCLEASLSYAEEAANHRGQAASLYHLGRIETTRGDFARAVTLFERCLTIAQQVEDSEALCWSHASMGNALRSIGEHDRAVVHLRQSEFLAQRLGDQSAHASSLLGLGAVYLDRGDCQSAISYCTQALAVAEALPDTAVILEVFITLAESLLEQGDVAEANRYARQALDLCQQTGNVKEAHALAVLGNARQRAGDFAGAVDAWRRAAALFDELGNASQAAAVRVGMSDGDRSSL